MHPAIWILGGLLGLALFKGQAKKPDLKKTGNGRAPLGDYPSTPQGEAKVVQFSEMLGDPELLAKQAEWVKKTNLKT
jgi:hypothetical protein